VWWVSSHVRNSFRVRMSRMFCSSISEGCLLRVGYFVLITSC
jgi:hypothetical protein